MTNNKFHVYLNTLIFTTKNKYSSKLEWVKAAAIEYKASTESDRISTRSLLRTIEIIYFKSNLLHPNLVKIHQISD